MAKEVKKTTSKENLAMGCGRRKTAVARVYMRQGSGEIIVNGRTAEEFFANPLLMFIIKQPLVATDSGNKYDFLITVSGGGLSGQAGACRLGIARALVNKDEELKSVLRANGFLTRDSRMVERKKYGRKGARKHFQFSKR